MPDSSGISLQALGIALKLTFQGDNQFQFAETYYCILVSLSEAAADAGRPTDCINSVLPLQKAATKFISNPPLLEVRLCTEM